MIPIFILAVCFVHTLCASADSDALVTSKAYLDISIGDKAVGKIVIGLFGKTAPKTVKNFEALASHEVSKNYFGSENMRYRFFFRSERSQTISSMGWSLHSSVRIFCCQYLDLSFQHKIYSFVYVACTLYWNPEILKVTSRSCRCPLPSKFFRFRPRRTLKW